MNFKEHYKFSEFPHIPVGEYGYLLQGKGVISRVLISSVSANIDVQNEMIIKYQFKFPNTLVWVDNFNIFATMDEAIAVEKHWGYRSEFQYGDHKEYSSEHKGRTRDPDGWLTPDSAWSGEGYTPF